ncbi:putative hydrolase or acyltransferase of alpha/beta superfamily [Burkholderiales bacterium JOSHI_001]|nr:putative hydrolase or acyltransferase of alpha/beta superfamily [Burkholderiales bacterium JOSHI_001]
MNRITTLDGIEVHTSGQGAQTVVMVHGWPDTRVLWDAQVDALAPHYRCVRFTLPGFDARLPRRAFSLDEVVAFIARVVDAASPDAPVLLMVHDWGCVFGCEYALRHPQRVARIVAVDVGDAGSGAHAAALPGRAKAFVLGYQLFLALAWGVGAVAPALGDRMTRFMARAVKCRSPQASISAQMNYPYFITWFGAHGGYRKKLPLKFSCPVLFLYGSKKPFLFHSQAWAERLAASPGNQVLALRTGHWVMRDAPDEFNRAVLAWLQA